MPEYITYNPLNGRIIDKFYSVDPSVVEGRNNLLQIPRDIFNSLTKFHKIDNGQIRLMTIAQQNALIAEENQAQIDVENLRIADLDDLMNIDLSGIILSKVDNAINNIANLSDAKVFLKKLCRYIVKFVARNI